MQSDDFATHWYASRNMNGAASIIMADVSRMTSASFVNTCQCPVAKRDRCHKEQQHEHEAQGLTYASERFNRKASRLYSKLRVNTAPTDENATRTALRLSPAPSRFPMSVDAEMEMPQGIITTNTVKFARMLCVASDSVPAPCKGR